MKRVYYLSTCDTCKRIMAQVPDIDQFEQIDIKKENISPSHLEKAAKSSGGYEQVFSKRARKYREHNLHQQDLKEEDFKRLILEEYSFLKRPLFFIDDDVFVGNSKKTVAAILDR